MNNYIKNNNIILKIVCKEEIIFYLKKEFSDYYEFIVGNYKQDFTIYIYTEHTKYKRILKQFYYPNNNLKLKLFKDRDGLIILDKNKHEIITFYDEINDNNIQFIEEIIISIFGIFLTKQNYFFVHAACVEKHGKSIAIVGDRATGKTTLLNILLQNKFNFVCNSHLGIRDIGKNVQVIGYPSRMGMRVETMEKSTSTKIKNKIFSNTEFRKRFGRNAEEDLKLYRNKKFNIKLNEIKDIYNVNLISSSLLSLIIVPIYIEQLEHIKIKKVDEINKIETLMRNKREGIYDTNKYLKIIENNNCKLPINIKNIEMYKIYQNERSINELVDFIKNKL